MSRGIYVDLACVLHFTRLTSPTISSTTISTDRTRPSFMIYVFLFTTVRYSTIIMILIRMSLNKTSDKCLFKANFTIQVRGS